MKNPLEQFKFWKRQNTFEPGLIAAQALSPSAAVAHASHPTIILKDFISAMNKKLDPVVLDIGPVVSSNIDFFLNLGIKLYMEEFLAAYMNPKYSTPVENKVTFDDQKFFAENFHYADEFFDGLICWDVLSYLEPKFAKTFAQRISAKMKPDSFVLGFFHTQKGQSPVSLHKFRILSESQFEYIPMGRTLEVKKGYQTREVSQLFGGYESQRFCLLKHNMLEVLLRKHTPSQNQ